MRITLLFVAAAGLSATNPGSSASQEPKTVHVSLATETAGREPKTFAPLVGSWVITKDAGKNVLFIDGRVWKRGQPAGGLADKARELYGARNEQFIDNVKAWAYFPYAVAKEVPDFREGQISIRFKMVEAYQACDAFGFALDLVVDRVRHQFELPLDVTRIEPIE